MMKGDEKFEDLDETPLKIKAVDTEDLKVISTFLQDSVFNRGDFHYDPKTRKLNFLLNRLRWEYKRNNPTENGVERVKSLLIVEDVMECTYNLSKGGNQVPLCLLNIEFISSDDGMGELKFNLSGYWNIKAKVECINLYLSDVTKPYIAPSKKLPKHPE